MPTTKEDIAEIKKDFIQLWKVVDVLKARITTLENQVNELRLTKKPEPLADADF